MIDSYVQDNYHYIVYEVAINILIDLFKDKLMKQDLKEEDYIALLKGTP